MKTLSIVDYQNIERASIVSKFYFKGVKNGILAVLMVKKIPKYFES
ncbi:MAG: hypothetical protein J1F05_05960 [Muribaculaceae bacterium]|nr:hypothetical protein [Muribaculaceae bacterium]